MENEHERAARYEARKDDQEEWGDAEQPKARRRLASMISVRLSPKEAVVVRAAAEERGLSVSAFLRNTALEAARSPEQVAPRWPAVLSRLSSGQAVPAVRAAVTILSGPADVDLSLVGDTHEPTFSI